MRSRFAAYLTYLLTLTHSDIDHPSDVVENAQFPEARRISGQILSFLRQLVLPKPMKHWATTTLREKLIKIGAKAVHHAR